MNDIADAIEACDWSGCSIGNKAILRAAVNALRSPPLPAQEAEPVAWIEGERGLNKLAAGSPTAAYSKQDEWYSTPLYLHPTPAHSDRLRHSLQNAADSLASRPRELRGPFKSGATAPAHSGEREALERENAIMREALGRLSGLTPFRANARTAGELHKSVKAIAGTALAGGDIGPEQPWLDRVPLETKP